MQCAKEVIAARVAGGTLRQACTGTVTRYYARSTCDLPAGLAAGQTKVPCLKRRLLPPLYPSDPRSGGSGTVSCAIKPAAQCVSKEGKFDQRPCPQATTCIAATDTNGDGLISAADIPDTNYDGRISAADDLTCASGATAG